MTETPHRPEQLQALDYLRRAGSEAPVASIRKRAAATFAEIEELLAGLDETVARKRPAAGKWSVQEVVDHLVESHRPAVDDVARLIAGEDVAEAVPASLQSADPLGWDWPERRADLAAVHRDLLAHLDGADDTTPQQAKTPVVMVVKCATDDGGVEVVEWVEHFGWKASALLIRVHTLEHTGQVRRVLEAMG
ncbi:MAG TPA: DinB family protein [Thermoanaerobaculia bacterium]|nr:DinB family protein [Thermoanaerobaculia bacterium]